METQLRYVTILLGQMPTDPKYGLNNSVLVQGSTDTRVCFDPNNNEIVVFMEHDEKRYHGIVRGLKALEPDIRQTLLDNFVLASCTDSEKFVTYFDDNTDLLESFENVKNAITNEDYEYVLYIMPAIGRDGLYLDDLKQIVHLCTMVHNSWVQRAAYICLYNLLIRYTDYEFDDFFTKIIDVGINNKSTQVQSIIRRIILFCREFNVKPYNRLAIGK